MAGVQRWVEGFVFRGRPPWSEDAPAWHVEVGRSVEDEDERREMLAPLALTPEQAEVAGFPLSAVLDGINAAALANADAVRQERDAATKARDAALEERDAMAARLAAFEAAPAGTSAPRAAVVSDRQFFQALANDGAITPEEALAAVMTGVLPNRIEAAVSALPELDQFAARMLLSGATTFERGHPMVAQLGAALGYDAAALDALWSTAAAL